MNTAARNHVSSTSIRKTIDDIRLGKHIRQLFSGHLRHLLRNRQVLWKLTRNYYRLVVLRQPTLRKVEFALTYACTANCVHCSAEHLRKSGRNELDRTAIQDTVAQAVKLGAIDIHFTGGEALLHSEIEPILRSTSDQGVITSIATNGILLSRENVNMLARSGVSFISISIDSPKRAEHDQFRRHPGCFDAVISGTQRCRDAGLDVFLCTVVTGANLASGELAGILEIAEKLGARLTLVLPCTVGRWRGQDAVLLNDRELAEYRRILAHPAARWEGESNYLAPGCPAGSEKIYITPYGDILPCNFHHVSFGNVSSCSLEVAWKRMGAVEHLKRHFGACKAGADREFIREFMGPANESAESPMSWENHPLANADDAE